MGYKKYDEKYIYCITNLINNKKYIGQSYNPKIRFQQHCTKHTKRKDKSLINDAILKYGKNNFKMEILYFGKDFNEKEQYYIQNLNTLVPNGYNIAIGGENPPIQLGEDSCRSKLTENEVIEIQLAFCFGKTTSEIYKQYKEKITQGQLNRINNGEAWYNDNLKYPLNDTPGPEISKQIIIEIINDIKNTNMTLKKIGEKYGYCKSAIVLINQGKTKKVQEVYKGSFPIRQRYKK